MTIWDAIILGIVEGITEFLPVSSTGHLILTSRLLEIPDSDFLKSFKVAIQVGAILSVLVLYARTLVLNSAIIMRVIAAFIPTAVLGFIFYKAIKTYLLGSETVAVWALAIGGVILIIFEMFYKEKEDAHQDLSSLPYRVAVMIGVFQAIAMIPGVSRSAATIIGGLAMRMKRKTIVEFSFLLAVPTMLAATALDLIRNPAVFAGENTVLFTTGFVTSFIVALLAIKWLLFFIKRHNFIPFGIYRIIVALIFWKVFYF